MNDLLEKFEKYMEEWKELDRQYHAVLPIPIYHFIKQMIILNKKSKLTEDYSRYLDEVEKKNSKSAQV